jgi:hypothetical protein
VMQMIATAKTKPPVMTAAIVVHAEGVMRQRLPTTAAYDSDCE